MENSTIKEDIEKCLEASRRNTGKRRNNKIIKNMNEETHSE